MAWYIMYVAWALFIMSVRDRGRGVVGDIYNAAVKYGRHQLGFIVAFLKAQRFRRLLVTVTRHSSVTTLLLLLFYRAFYSSWYPSDLLGVLYIVMRALRDACASISCNHGIMHRAPRTNLWGVKVSPVGL